MNPVLGDPKNRGRACCRAGVTGAGDADHAERAVRHADSHYERMELGPALSAYWIAEKLYRDLNDAAGVAIVLLGRGATLLDLRDETSRRQARYLVDEALGHLTQADQELLHRRTFYLGVIAHQDGDTAGALRYLGDAQAGYEALANDMPDGADHFKRKAAGCLVRIADINGLLDPESAIEDCQRALSRYEELPATQRDRGYIDCRTMLARFLTRAARWDEADAACQAALPLADAVALRSLAAEIRLLHAYVLWQRNKSDSGPKQGHAQRALRLALPNLLEVDRIRFGLPDAQSRSAWSTGLAGPYAFVFEVAVALNDAEIISDLIDLKLHHGVYGEDDSR